MDKYVSTSHDSLEEGLQAIPSGPLTSLGMHGESRIVFKYKLHSWQKIDHLYHFVWELVKP